ncbi:15308_t:CDS:2, partial [Funneliformis geosporum]
EQCYHETLELNVGHSVGQSQNVWDIENVHHYLGGQWVGLAEFTRKWHKKDNESDISSNSDEVNFEKVFEGEFFDGFHDREDDNGNSSDSKSLDSHSSRQRR